MNSCRMTLRILITLLAVLALCVSVYAAKEAKPLSLKVQTGQHVANPNWDLKAQMANDEVSQPVKPGDPSTHVGSVVASSPENGMAPGDDCANPIAIDISTLPVSLLNETNCGNGNTYDATCLGATYNYDGGEDRMYKLTVGAGNLTVKITLDPHGSTWSGWLIDGSCPPNPTTCLAVTTTTGGTAYSNTVTFPAAGTYYMMVDTWPTPNCIPQYDLTFAAPPAGPANDNCANATPIGDVSNVAFDCTAATGDGPLTFVSNRNVWFLYTASCNGVVTAMTCGSSYDTKLAVWDATGCPPTTMIASNDDGCSSYGSGSTYASLAVFGATAGHQYLIEIGPYSSSTTVGTGLLSTSCVVAPTGGVCSSAFPITLNPGVLPYSLTGQTTCGFLNAYNSTCLGSYDEGEDVIYELDVTQPTSVDVTLDPNGTTYSGFLIDDACPPDPSTCLYKKTSSGSAPYTINSVMLNPGTYYLIVDSYSYYTACVPNFTLTFTVPAGPPANDNCANATPIGDVTNLAFSTGAATPDGPDSYIVSPDIWYCYTASCTGAITADICNSSFDTRMQVFDGCTCPPTALVIQDDDGCSTPNGLGSLCSWAGVAGHQYMIQVGGYSSNSGTGFLNVQCTPPPPNDLCEDVTPVPLTIGSPLTFTGNNAGATGDCAILGDPTVWHAFTTTTCMDVTVDYCGTTPAFGNVWIVLVQGCPCGNYIIGSYETTTCGDGNVAIHYAALPAGTWYVPVLNDPSYGAVGPYTVHVTGSTVAAYCSSASLTYSYESIDNFTLGSFSNPSGASPYSDFTGSPISVTQGESYNVTVDNYSGYSTDQCDLFIDWDGDFCWDEDIITAGSPGVGPYSATISVPCNVPLGTARLRVVLLDTYANAMSPCGSYQYGETEDYALSLQPYPVIPPVTVMLPNPQYTYFANALNPVIDQFFVGNFAGHVPQDVNMASVTVNGLTPSAVTTVPSYAGMYCGALQVSMPLASFIAPYGTLFDTTQTTFTVAGTMTDATPWSLTGDVTLIGHSSLAPGQFIVPPQGIVLPGDFDADGVLDISDPVAMIGYIFGGSHGPANELIGDVDCSRSVDISDVVYMIQYIFGGGPAPCSR